MCDYTMIFSDFCDRLIPTHIREYRRYFLHHFALHCLELIALDHFSETVTFTLSAIKFDIKKAEPTGPPRCRRA